MFCVLSVMTKRVLSFMTIAVTAKNSEPVPAGGSKTGRGVAINTTFSQHWPSRPIQVVNQPLSDRRRRVYNACQRVRY